MTTTTKSQLATAEVWADGAPGAWRRWAAVVAVSLGTLAFVTTEMLPVGVLPDVGDGLHVSVGVAGLVVTVYGVAAGLGAPLLTSWTGRLDRRTLLAGLLLLLVLGNLATAWAPSFALVMIARAVLGFANGVFWSIGASTAIRLVPEQDATKATAIVLGGISVASVVGVPVGTVIGQAASWRVAFAVVGLFAVLVLVAVRALLPPVPSAGVSRLSGLPALFSSTSLRWGVAITAVFVTGHFAAFTYVRTYLQREAGVSAHWISVVLLAYGAAGIVGTVVAGSAVARNLRAAFVVSCSVLAVSLVVLVLLGRTGWGATAMLIVWGASYAVVPVCLQTWVMKSVPQAESATSIYVLSFNLAVAVGAFAGGEITDGVGVSWVMWFGAAFAAVSVLGAVASRDSAT